MIPIIACSIVAAGIAIERAWTLRRQTVAPRHLLADVLVQIEAGALTPEALNQLQLSSPLGQVLAAGIQQNPFGRDPMLRSIEATGIQVVHDLERYLSTLGSVAAIAPLLGLLGTVIGMIKVFSAIQLAGIGNAPALAGGISEALITTAAGLSVAIPSLIMHRYFVGRIDGIVIGLEQETIKLVDALHNDPAGSAGEGGSV